MSSDDPETVLREMVKIPTLDRSEKAAAQDGLTEFLHYKRLRADMEPRRRGLFRRR